ncbi:hypothetical protein BDZ91DRAFT_739447 [Kalaharituber pfeilii]|nr:hypothetical protein BDZ91DRAFT_739447 [Kalaharituber pfeilii]
MYLSVQLVYNAEFPGLLLTFMTSIYSVNFGSASFWQQLIPEAITSLSLTDNW